MTLQINKKNVDKIIQELQERNEVIPCTSDTIFKAIFQDKELKGILAIVICRLTGLSREFVMENIKYRNSEIPKSNILQKNNINDLVVDVGNNIIMLEMNATNDMYNNFRNMSHYHSMIVNSIKVADKIEDLVSVIQINFDNKRVLANQLISEIRLVEVNSGILDPDEKLFKKYRINLSFVRNMRYNDEGTRFERLLQIMQEKNKTKLRKLANKDKEFELMVKKIEKLSSDSKYVSLYDEEKLDKLARSYELSETKKQGVAEGIIEEKNEIARNMLKEKADIEFISKVTGLTEKEIKDLQ